MPSALEGIKILDLGHVLAAPFCTMILADLGAEVIKVESPIGDDSRQFGPFIGEADGAGKQSGYFISINRNKKSMCVDLKKPEGKSLLKDLIKKCDVVVENYRPTTMRKLGFSYEQMKEINPGVIYCSICGFGHDALPENAEKPAYDMVAQAYSGLMSITGHPGSSPCRVGTSVGDIVAGHQAAIGILSALNYRARTGKGQYVDISMVDGLVYIMENAIARYTINGEIPEPLGSAHPTITPFQAFETKDGWIITPIGNDSLWKNFCGALKIEELAEDPRFVTNPMRTANKAELNAIVSAVMIQKNTDAWTAIFDEYKLPYSKINDVGQVVNDEQINYRKMIVEIDQPNIGPMKIIGTPFHMTETPGNVRHPAPLLGQHTTEVLTDLLDMDMEKIGSLRQMKVIM